MENYGVDVDGSMSGIAFARADAISATGRGVLEGLSDGVEGG